MPPVSYSPIALFVYNRPMHTKRTVEFLSKNAGAKSSQLYIFSDAAKTTEQQLQVQQIREYIPTIKGFKKIHIIERDSNLGLANSIIDGVSRLCKQYGKVIVLEDDLEVSPYFLQYMNAALTKYEPEPSIGSISGYMYPVELSSSHSTFLAKAPQSWGWATWERAWRVFDADNRRLIDKIKREKLVHEFESNGPHAYIKMLENNVSGKNDSWFVRWYASSFLNNLKTVMPTTSLVRNIGIDGTGTHCAEWKIDPYYTELAAVPIDPSILQQTLNSTDLRRLSSFFRKVKRLRYINFLYRQLARVGL